ncbi:MAG: Gfo/Idh/MocA family oxidoreductase [Anaerolineae bacterium]
MTAFDRIRAGLIGGGVGAMYAAALHHVRTYYPTLPPVDLVAVATATEGSGRRLAAQLGFERATTDYRELLAADDINVVFIATPNHLHREMLIEGLRSGKAIYIDKPLTNTLAEAREVQQVARQTGRDAHVGFDKRFNPALLAAHRLIAAGRIGTIYALRAAYFRPSYADPDRSLRWKAAQPAAGALGDLGAHLLDMVIWLAGMPSAVSAQTRTFVTERPSGAADGGRVPVETDDHAILLCRLPGQAIGTVEAGRMITGSVNDLSIAIYGSKGALRWSIMDPNYLEFVDGALPEDERGWLRIPTVQRYAGAALPRWDVPVGWMRFTVESVAAFLRAALEGRPYDPGIEQGVRVQAVIEAGLEAARRGVWVDVEGV